MPIVLLAIVQFINKISNKSLTYPFPILFIIFDRVFLISLCPVLTILLDTR